MIVGYRTQENKKIEEEKRNKIGIFKNENHEAELYAHNIILQMDVGKTTDHTTTMTHCLLVRLPRCVMGREDMSSVRLSKETVDSGIT